MKHAVSGTKRMRSTLSSLAAVLSALLPLALTAQTNGIRCESTSSVSPAILQAAQGYAGVRDATRYVKRKVIIASQTGLGDEASTHSIG